MAGRPAVPRVVLVCAVVLGGAVLLHAWNLVGYLKAETEYRRLHAHKPKTRAEVDRILSAWPHRRIEKSESDFGRHTAITGEYERYSVLGAPIDVVYDKSGRIIVILPSYE